MNINIFKPLADRMRPKTIDEFFGQQHLLAQDSPLGKAIRLGKIHSMIFWGPPGTGKTTLAKLLAANADANWESLSAVFSGVKEIRAAIDRAQQALAIGQKTILFIDEVHRFNKTQQDAFLPFVEDGTITFIGATTENPSFEINNALLSRASVYVLKTLTIEAIIHILKRALQDSEYGLGHLNLSINQECLEQLAKASDGDARRALSYLEMIADLSIADEKGNNKITQEIIDKILTNGVRRFDKGGDDFYDQISALHKSIRGSSPDAALYWLSRMLDGGCDPLYLARRLVRMASEDIGNADPRALTLALNAWDVQERLGSPEGELALAQAVTYLACTAKSNAVYKAFNAAYKDAQTLGSLPVPLHLRNAPTQLMRELNYGKNYRYAHDEVNAYAAGEYYFPDEIKAKKYYYPVNRGMEIKIAEKLANLETLNKK